MDICTYGGSPVAEPDPLRGCIHEQQAAEESPRCAYCDACEVTNEGEFCSDACSDLAAYEWAEDAADDLMHALEDR